MLRLFVCKREREGPSFPPSSSISEAHPSTCLPPSPLLSIWQQGAHTAIPSLPPSQGRKRQHSKFDEGQTQQHIKLDFFTSKKSTGKCTFRGSVRLCVFSGHSSPNPVPGRHIYFETEAEAGDGSVVFFDEAGTCTPRFPANKKDDNYCNGNSPFYLHPLPAGD